MRDRNSFRVGSAPHKAEDATFAVFDENTIEQDFAEISEYAEQRVADELRQTVSSGEASNQEADRNSLETHTGTKVVRDVVMDYVDRFPNSGQ